jgi:hypothetical protein
MGTEVYVGGAAEALSFPSLLERLAGAGLPSTIVMVDHSLVKPGASPPPTWRDVRLRTPAGMVTIVRRGDDVSVAVFGNASPALLEAQRRIGELLAPDRDP